MRIDLIKVLCMLYIIGFRHLLNYSEVYSPCHILSYEVTISALGAFVFYAGWFFQNLKFESPEALMDFYKKRIFRFYILYSISLLTMYIGGLLLHKPWFDSSIQFVLSFMGLTAFYLPNVGTLWFMSMLMFFYLITPFVLMVKGSFYKRSIAGIIILSLFSLYLIMPSNIDFRLPLYFFFYAMGLLIPHEVWNRSIMRVSWYAFFIGVVAFIFLVMLDVDDLLMAIVVKILYILDFVVFLTYICSVVVKYAPERLGGAISALSYILLSAYLFHRQIFQLLKYGMNNVLHIDLSLSILVFVFLPVCFVLSYFIQLIYDKIIAGLSPK